MIEQLPSKRYKFTAKDLFKVIEGSPNSIRHRVTKLSKDRVIRVIGKVPATNEKIYTSDTDPLVLFKLELPPEQFTPMYELKEITGFFNNPFNIKDAIDMRWKRDAY